MLVLTRKLQEQIRIGEDITITILRIKGGRVQLGIEAPREVRVLRAELPSKERQALADANGREASDAVDDREDAAAGDAPRSEAWDRTTVRDLAAALLAEGPCTEGVVSYAV